MLLMYPVLVYIYFHVFPVRVAISRARRKETRKEAWKVRPASSKWNCLQRWTVKRKELTVTYFLYEPT
jgi:hypothetical protein